MDKLQMQSKNLVNENISKIERLFPNCVTEARDENGRLTKLVDFDMLKQELSNVVIDGDKERYTFVWPDKKQAMLTANAPIAKTLRPCREESVDFDHTQNLYIEGDNLDVLKLLRETYLGKIKMIYIDPPYNTGNDFVYNDDFAVDTDEYLERSNQIDDQGNRMVANNDSNGRFHTDWLNMIYPRLKLAKDLLTDDGAIFISIDDNEQANLKKICDEIFGENNFVSNLVWKSKSGGANDVCAIATDSENILLYARNIKSLKMNLDTDAEVTTSYNCIDENGNRYGLDRLDKQSLGYHESLDFPITGPDGRIYVVQHKNPNNKVARWRWGEKTIKERYNELVFKYPYVYTKNYEKEGSIPRNLLIDERFGRSRTGKTEVAELFDKIAYFDFPKPTKLIKYLIKIFTNKDDVILDFFSGSATTAHSVMMLNSEDAGKRRYICIQLPEKCDTKSKAFIDGYKNICEIGKERIRRAGEKIKNEVEKENMKKSPEELMQLIIDEPNERKHKEIQKNYLKKCPDIGFRNLKLDSSCMKDVYYSPNKINQDLLSQLEDNIKEDRTAEDLLFQVMLDMGVMLSSEIKTINVQGKKVFNVNDGNLVCCFEKELNENIVTEIAKMRPLYAVFRDAGMQKDCVSVNFDQIFETYSPTTTRKVL